MANKQETKEYIYNGKKYSAEEIKQLLSLEGKMPSRMKAILQMVEGDIVLDVGCGVGTFAYLLAKEEKIVTRKVPKKGKTRNKSKVMAKTLRSKPSV